MGGIEDHRRAGRLGHDRQRAHVRDEGVVAEARAALGDEDIAVAGAGDLGDDMLHVPGREELPLLDIDDAVRSGRRRPGDRSAGRGRPGFADMSTASATRRIAQAHARR